MSMRAKQDAVDDEWSLDGGGGREITARQGAVASPKRPQGDGLMTLHTTGPRGALLNIGDLATLTHPSSPHHSRQATADGAPGPPADDDSLIHTTRKKSCLDDLTADALAVQALVVIPPPDKEEFLPPEVKPTWGTKMGQVHNTSASVKLVSSHAGTIVAVLLPQSVFIPPRAIEMLDIDTLRETHPDIIDIAIRPVEVGQVGKECDLVFDGLTPGVGYKVWIHLEADGAAPLVDVPVLGEGEGEGKGKGEGKETVLGALEGDDDDDEDEEEEEEDEDEEAKLQGAMIASLMGEEETDVIRVQTPKTPADPTAALDPARSQKEPSTDGTGTGAGTEGVEGGVEGERGEGEGEAEVVPEISPEVCNIPCR